MTNRQAPPGRKSKACVVARNPFGPHHCTRWFGSVQTEKTGVRGAASTRVPMIECGSRSRSMLFLVGTLLLQFALLLLIARFVTQFVFVLLRLEDPQIVVEAVEALFPEPAIFLEPVVGVLECALRCGTDASARRACA